MCHICPPSSSQELMVKQRIFDGSTSKKSLLAAERAQELCLTKQRSFGLDISKNQTDLAGKSLQKATATNSQGTGEQWRHAEHGHYSLFLSKAREIIKLSTITSSPIMTKYTHCRILFWIKIMYLFENKAWFFFKEMAENKVHKAKLSNKWDLLWEKKSNNCIFRGKVIVT